jgi:orotate phosphoribosyltransferase
MKKKFIYSEPKVISDLPNEKAITYCIPNNITKIIKHINIALVDDVINAGSAIIATIKELNKYDAHIEVVGTLIAIGSFYNKMTIDNEIPIKALGRIKSNIWPPAECPLCKTGRPIDNY